MTTESDRTERDQLPEEWARIPGYRGYEASSRGQIRSVDRVSAAGKRLTGRVLKPRLSTAGYWQVNLTGDDGQAVTQPVHQLVMLAFEGPPKPGQQVRHFNDDPDDNRWAPGGEDACGPGKPGNLVYGTPEQNKQDKLRNHPPRPRPAPRVCEPHGRTVTGGSKTRCDLCVRALAAQAAGLLAEGCTREQAAERLNYSHPEGLEQLAIRHAGWDPAAPARPRGVLARARSWWRRHRQ